MSKDAVAALHGGGIGASKPQGQSSSQRGSRRLEAGGGKIASPPMERPGGLIVFAEVVDTEGSQYSLIEYGT